MFRIFRYNKDDEEARRRRRRRGEEAEEETESGVGWYVGSGVG